MNGNVEVEFPRFEVRPYERARLPLIAALVGLISGGTVVLAVLVAATLALWLTATIRHAVLVPYRTGERA